MKRKKTATKRFLALKWLACKNSTNHTFQTFSEHGM